MLQEASLAAAQTKVESSPVPPFANTEYINSLYRSDRDRTPISNVAVESSDTESDLNSLTNKQLEDPEEQHAIGLSDVNTKSEDLKGNVQDHSIISKSAADVIIGKYNSPYASGPLKDIFFRIPRKRVQGQGPLSYSINIRQIYFIYSERREFIICCTDSSEE